MRWILMVACAICGSLLSLESASANNELMRGLLASAVKNSLVGYNSKETGWHQYQKEDKQEWVSGRTFFGISYKTLVAEWTEETKVWVWLDQPEANLQVRMDHFAIADNRVHYDLVISGKAKFNAWGKIQRVAEGDFKGHCKAEVRIAGSFGITAERLADSQVTVLTGSVSEVHFNNDLLQAFRQLIQRELNSFIGDKAEQMKGKLNDSINSVHF